MAIRTHFLTEETYQYLLKMSLREHPLLRSLREETLLMTDAIMQASAEQGQFMQLLVKLMDARRILEIGVFTGYSALSMALALPEDGRILACDINEEWTNMAKRYWKDAGVTHKIKLYLKPAAEFLKELPAREPFDLIFLDADQANYDLYYELSLPLLRTGGLLILDDTLWEGKVTDPQTQDPKARGIHQVNQKLLRDPRVDISLLPIGDGLTLARKR